jgi:hypothetical protein
MWGTMRGYGADKGAIQPMAVEDAISESRCYGSTNDASSKQSSTRAWICIQDEEQ